MRTAVFRGGPQGLKEHQTMRVAMYYNNRDVRIEEMEIPAIGPDEMLVKIWASGICGSDVMEWYRLAKAPLVLGHEIAGEIAVVGESVPCWKKGDRVFVSHHVPCNMCRFCVSGHHSVCDTLSRTNFDPGGFCEYVRVPAVNVRNGVYLLPDSVSYEEAVFIEPLACVLRGQHHAGWLPGRRVLVIGSGIAGLLHIPLARVAGASRVFAVDVNPTRLDAALTFGADHVLTAGDDLVERFLEANDGRLADLVIVATGAKPAIEQAFRLVERGGRILFFAPADPGAEIRIPFNDVWRKEVTTTTSYAGSPRDILGAIELLAANRLPVADMITHRLRLEETAKGFALVAGAADSIKVIIEPQS
ncbi:MAG: alcohol dehydrogenase catalytic domain-containing protein [Thermodesulfobacteriota bacterium]